MTELILRTEKEWENNGYSLLEGVEKKETYSAKEVVLTNDDKVQTSIPQWEEDEYPDEDYGCGDPHCDYCNDPDEESW